MNREKINGFELCANGEPCTGEKFVKCPFSPRNNAEQNCGVTMARIALSLLKEQEAVEPTFRQGEDGVFVWACGSCGAYMYHIYDGIDKAKEYAKYCRQCGKKVKWE